MEVIDESDSIVFLENADSLYKTALAYVKLSLHHVIVVSERLNGGSRYVKSPSDLISVPLPETIKRAINSGFWSIDSVSNEWWSYHKERIFFDCRAANLNVVDLLDQVAWLPDLTIHYRRTAQRVMTCSKLTSVQKFRMAALYCLGDDVVGSACRNLTKTELVNLWNELNRSSRPQHFVVRYWFSKFCGLGQLRSQDGNIGAVLRKILNFGKSPLWSTTEYFFDRLEVAKRPNAIGRILDRRPQFRISLLTKLTGLELDEVLKRRGESLFISLAKKSENEKYTLAVWKRMLPLIDERIFRPVFPSILRASLLPQEYRVRLSFELWSCLDDELKTRMARSCANELIVLGKPGGWGRRPICFDLIIDVLTRNDFQYRNEYWMQYWQRFIHDCHRKGDIEKIMLLCLANREAVNNFKRDIMSNYAVIKLFCEVLFKWGDFDKLQDFLEVCSPDSATISNLKKKIFAMPDVHQILFRNLCGSRHEAFDRLIEGVFDDETSTKSFKNLLVTIPKNLAKLQSSLRTGLFDEVASFVKLYLSDEEETARVKLQFIEIFRLMILECATGLDAKVDQWNNFATWLFNGDSNRIAEFKSSISAQIENIFATKLSKIVSRMNEDFFYYNIDEKHLAPKKRKISKSMNTKQIENKVYEENFRNFDEALLWILGSEDEVVRVKSSIINRKLEFEYLIECLTMKDKRIVDAVLDFFFNREAHLRDQFKEAFKQEKRTL